MNYSEAVAFLNCLTDYERASDYRYDSKHFGLERVAKLLSAVGDPHHALTCVIIAGTNGKGSTAAILTSILKASGHTVGLYTSPHLVEYRERLRIGLEPVSEEEFAHLAERLVEPMDRLRTKGGSLQPTTFEVLTAMALLGFAARGVSMAVLEVGLGGRLDAVNIVNPVAVCVTPISLDHTDQLGATVEAVAKEKAGVIKSAVPVTSGAQPPAALAVIQEACHKVKAPLKVVERELLAKGITCGQGGSSFTALTPRGRFESLYLNLLGQYQVGNALTALGCALALPVLVPEDGIRRGLREAVWPGRLQLWQRTPRVLLDGAHNAESAAHLVQTCDTLFAPDRLALIFSQLRGKEHQAVARILCSQADEVFIPELRHPRALPAEELAAAARPFAKGIAVYPSVAEALAAACAKYSGERDLILVTGSLALVGEVMRDACIS